MRDTIIVYPASTFIKTLGELNFILFNKKALILGNKVQNSSLPTLANIQNQVVKVYDLAELVDYLKQLFIVKW